MFSKTFSIRTRERLDIFEITGHVDSVVKESKIKSGLCFVSIEHTTACLIINENDPGLLEDIKKTLEKLIPRNGRYSHNRSSGEGNAYAHIWSSIIKPYLVVPVENGSLKLGTWQSLFFLEMDGPRSRDVTVQVFG